jgi:hypothetical protein
MGVLSFGELKIHMTKGAIKPFPKEGFDSVTMK